MSARIGIDLGGTKIEGVVLDESGTTLASRRVATPQHDYAGTIAAVAALVDGLRDVAGPDATVGIGAPGSQSLRTDAAGRRLWKGANSTWLNGRPLEADLTAAIGPIRIANDANCFAVSEAIDGAAAGAGVVFGVIIGTGCGGGIVVEGRPVAGLNGIAGEWGHMPLPWPTAEEYPGRDCYCGRRGCMETWISGPSLERDHAGRGGDAMRATDIAASDTSAAQAALDAYISRLARGLAVVCDVLDPDVIVLGGGVSRVAQLYERVPAAIAAHVFSDTFDTPVRPAVHGDASGVRGAALLWAR